MHKKPLNILFASSEAGPFAKTGGLADVAWSLPKTLVKMGLDVRIVMPKYRSMEQKFNTMTVPVASFHINAGWRSQYCEVEQLELDGVKVYFIDNKYYFDRDGLYGYHDEGEQFAFFCRAVVEILPYLDWKPDIIHCNDWQTGVVPLLLKGYAAQKASGFENGFLKDIKAVFTIHNLRYQGIFPKMILTELLGLGWEYFTPEGIEFYDQVNFMKAGLVFSHAITTVSPTYADEIKTPCYGEMLDGVLRQRENRLYGILNGIDMQEYNPWTDKQIFARYSACKPLDKVKNKHMLQETLGLPRRDDVPVVGIISRLVDQKGFDLIADVFNEILQEDIQLVILGTGSGNYEEIFRLAAREYPAKVSANIAYDDVLARRIYAGSDMFLMPSLFEPCGLAQLFAMRYGSIPIVRETGGLKDTVIPYNEYTGEGTGFSFADYNTHNMLYTLRRAVGFYKDKEVWKSLVCNAMRQDFSWRKSAKEYVRVYKSVLL